MSFELIYNFVAARIVAYGPSLVPYMQNKISLKTTSPAPSWSIR